MLIKKNFIFSKVGQKFKNSTRAVGKTELIMAKSIEETGAPPNMG